MQLKFSQKDSSEMLIIVDWCWLLITTVLTERLQWDGGADYCWLMLIDAECWLQLCSQKDSSEMVADEILSAVVDEIRVGVVQVKMVARLLKDRVALWDSDVASILPETWLSGFGNKSTPLAEKKSKDKKYALKCLDTTQKLKQTKIQRWIWLSSSCIFTL